jgi:hypothetical protein
MNNIKTYDDLLGEELELKSSLAIQKHVIEKEFHELKEQLKPALNILSFISKLFIRDKSNSLLSAGISIAGDVLFKNVILAKSGWLTRLVLPFVIKNYSSYFLKKNGNSIAQKIGRKIS